MKSVFLVTGEASGDQIAGPLLRKLKESKNISCFGIGGKSLEKEGMKIILPASEISVVGLSDWSDKFEQVISHFRFVCETLENNPPDLAILIDLPDLNFRLARILKRLNVPVIYYVSPQIWAWRKYRIRYVKAWVDKMLVLFPFEEVFYKQAGVEATFVGHPLVEKISARTQYRSHEDIVKAPRIALLPGSRNSEIKYHSKVLCETAVKLKEKYPNAIIKLPVANTLDFEKIRGIFSSSGIECVDSEVSPPVLEWADVALICSGTATLESSLIGTPFALFYHMSWLSELVIRFYNPKAFAITNWLLPGKPIHEYILSQFNTKNLFHECCDLIENKPYRDSVVSALKSCRNALATKSPVQNAVNEVLAFL